VTWWLYVLLCKGNLLYVGISPDPLRRFHNHQRGKSQFSRMRRPLELLAALPIGTHRDAAREEKTLKRMSPEGKWSWVAVARQSPAWRRMVTGIGHGKLVSGPSA
jgi:putative endonuclease